jgi:hypothetical protein
MKRFLVTLCAVVALAGCTSDSPSIEETADAPTTAPGGADAGTSTTAGPSRSIVVGGTDAVPNRSVTTASPQPVATGAVGSGAPRYLRAAESERIVVQVIVQSGAEPQRSTVDHVVSVLERASGKPVSTTGGSVDSDRDHWSSADIRAAAVDADVDTPSDVAVLRLLFLRGEFDEGRDMDGEIIGLSVASDVAAVFSDQVDGAATALVRPSHIEDAVTMHELGHLLGLVDLFLHTGRQDPDHPGHSRNRSSVMYWAVESSLVTDLLTGGPPREFDENDRSDLATIRHG